MARRGGKLPRGNGNKTAYPPDIHQKIKQLMDELKHQGSVPPGHPQQRGGKQAHRKPQKISRKWYMRWRW